MTSSHPWNTKAEAAPAFVVTWATGPDPELDGIFRILALAPTEDGWRAFDQWCLPYDEEAASARMSREFGVTGADLEGGADPRQAWIELDVFLGDGPVVTTDGEAFDAWSQALGGRPRESLGLGEVAGLFLPGRLAHQRSGLAQALLPRHEGPPAALFPSELVQALAELVRRAQARDPRVHALTAYGYGQAHEQLQAADPAAAERLALALAIFEQPSRWAQSTGELFHPGEGLKDGVLEAAAEAGADPFLLEELHPAVARAFSTWATAPELAPDPASPCTFHPEDRELLATIFEHHLPEVLVAARGGEASDYRRENQAQVATSVAETIGADELLLVHAPTGTGKTLAYLFPAILWARRHEARIGIATYTRALQEQAMDGEVPTALAALARAGVPGPTRISVLKGRENYLCYRALRSSPPDEEEDAEGWLAWTQLVLFALTDREGDLDRLPRQPPVRLTSAVEYRRRLGRNTAAVRARTGCCSHADDRSTCAAELARRRAERSHVVLTNQSFVLSRREFFRHLIFDECEHLHDVAATAWSSSLRVRRLGELLERLGSSRGRTAKAPLDRLCAQLLPGSFALEEAQRAAERCKEARRSLDRLKTEVEAFERWRSVARRGDEEQHQLFREYLETEEGDELVDTRLVLGRALGQLELGLGRVTEAIDGLPLRGSTRLRRTMDLARGDLTTALEELDAWLPVDGGQARLSRTAFHDVERDARGDLVLRASVLLPGQVLGRAVYPELGSAALLSATTKLSGGFDSARAYLGLDVAAEPDEEEEREPRLVRTAEAPEAFDYGRVLVGVPRDIPEPRDKDGHLAYVERFIDWLGERTRGRILVLFTNQADVKRVGAALAPRFRARRTPLYYQGMPEASKEELGTLFRDRTDSVLLGVDTFWFGADFPGETLEYLVLVRLPYGVPDSYHHAQRAALGSAEQRKQIYLPRALAKFRQGFGRLMRRPTDRGVVFVLDRRLTDPRHRVFLRELPLAGREGEEGSARLVRGDSTQVLRQALAHMGMLADLERRELSPDFAPASPALPEPPTLGYDEPPPKLDVPLGDLPF